MMRNIAVRVTSREINETIIHNYTTDDKSRRYKFTRDLQLIQRIKTVGIVVKPPYITDDEQYASVVINDLFGTIRLFITDHDIVKDVVSHLEPGDVVQVVGKISYNEVRKKNEIIVEIMNRVDPSVLILHNYKIIEKIKRHKEVVNIFKKILTLRKMMLETTDKNKIIKLKKKESLLVKSLDSKLRTVLMVVEDYIREKQVIDEFFEDEEIDTEEELIDNDSTNEYDLSSEIEEEDESYDVVSVEDEDIDSDYDKIEEDNKEHEEEDIISDTIEEEDVNDIDEMIEEDSEDDEDIEEILEDI